MALSLPSIAALYLSVNAFSCSGVPATIPNASVNRSAPATAKTFVDVVMAATVVGWSFRKASQFEKEKSLLSRVARAIPLSSSQGTKDG